MSSRFSITFGVYYSNLVFFNNSNDWFIGITSFIFADIKKFNTSDINAFSYTLIFALNYILIDFLNLLNKCIFALFNSLSFSFQYWSYKVFMLNEDINTIIKTIFFILSKISYIFIIIFVYINYRNNKNYFGYILLIFFFLICYPVLQYQIRHFVYLQFIMFLPFLFSMEYLYKKFVQK